MTLARSHEIGVQELPLLCQRLLEAMEPGELAAPVTLTENHMIAIQQAAQATTERKPDKPPRRPSPAVAQAWRNMHL